MNNDVQMGFRIPYGLSERAVYFARLKGLSKSEYARLAFEEKVSEDEKLLSKIKAAPKSFRGSVKLPENKSYKELRYEALMEKYE